MEITAVGRENGIAVAIIDGKKAWKMAHMRAIYPEFIEHDEIPGCEREFRDKNPDVVVKLTASQVAEWGWYLYESGHNAYNDFVADEERLRALKENMKFLVGYNVGKRNTLRNEITVTIAGKEERFTAKDLDRVKEIIEGMDRQIQALTAENATIATLKTQAKPRIRVQARRAA